MNFQDLISRIEAFPEREFFGPVSREIIDAASAELGVPLSAEYKEFLSTLGAGSVGSESLIGLGGPAHLDIVWLARKLRGEGRVRPLPDALVPVRTDGYGNYDCIDTSLPTTGGEFAIVEWRHEGPVEGGNRVLARGYFEWLAQILEMLSEIERES